MQITTISGQMYDCEDAPFIEGGEGLLFFTRDRRHIVKAYTRLASPQDWTVRRNTLRACIVDYNILAENPTYWGARLGWPLDMIEAPFYGMIMPRVPGQHRTLAWFLSGRARKLLAQQEPTLLGNWRGRLNIAIEMMRVVWTLHGRGLCHADFSGNNFLANEAAGFVALIDCDGLVVPGLYQPSVAGTPGYMAPEIYMGTATPTIDTDKHAMAVLLFQLLLFRHPLLGRRVNSADPQIDDLLTFGECALYCEHPDDASNRPNGRYVPAHKLGEIATLFERTFVQGIHTPSARPTAATWLSALERLQDRIVPCDNPSCPCGFFPLLDDKPALCPWCDTPLTSIDTVPVLTIYAPTTRGHYSPSGHRIVGWPGRTLHVWHVDADKRMGPHLQAGEEQPVAEFKRTGDAWSLVNLQCANLYTLSEAGLHHVPPNTWVGLQPNTRLLAGTLEDGRLMSVSLRRLQEAERI